MTYEESINFFKLNFLSFLFKFTENKVCRRIVCISIMAKTTSKTLRERLYIQRDQRGQIFVRRRR